MLLPHTQFIPYYKFHVRKNKIEFKRIKSYIKIMTKQPVGVSCLSSRNIIPAYAKFYAREYQLIRGINNEFGYLKNKLDTQLNNGLFESKIAKRIQYFIKMYFRAQEKGKLKNISYLKLQKEDLDNLLFFVREYVYYKIRYDFFDDDEKPYPGLTEFYDATFKFYNKLTKCYESDSDSDSDIVFYIDSDSD